ncbi:hypothetical protein IQ270_15540 [Microcoleus sp. LEGE 07076]|uniref:hypothetical protein n=1 Tax=Microcoleus sp. LEGE 07076 TaxID=915322 RepID=UPI001882F940|nr:hypothetical protein [Microcoleus sp. LEGE 07076]MBE9186061.1 hypothetical protein [Microcoleus sp. LEGE 07076]
MSEFDGIPKPRAADDVRFIPNPGNIPPLRSNRFRGQERQEKRKQKSLKIKGMTNPDLVLPGLAADESGWHQELVQQPRERIDSQVAGFGEINVAVRGKGRSNSLP